jgi:hypothetical protein
MRKLIVLFLVVSLLAVAVPAMAQLPGSLDPLGLITSGAVLPYVGFAGSASFLEAYAPVDGATLHMFFFDHNCVRMGDSLGLTLTQNDIEFLRVDNIGNTPPNGLLTIATSDGTGFFLSPLLTPINLRMLWVHPTEDFIRVIDPIALSTSDNDQALALTPAAPFRGSGIWNPLRTAASFWAPPEGSNFQTSIYLICPNTNIIGTAASTSRAFAIAAGAPPLIPAPQPPGQPTPLLIRVYDDEENFLRDISERTCTCFTQFPLARLSDIYGDARVAAAGTFTEMFGGTADPTPEVPLVCSTTEIVEATPDNPCPLDTAHPGFQFRVLQQPSAPSGGGPFSFTGYRSVVTGPRDLWNRLNGACQGAIAGAGGTCPLTPPTFGR